MCRAVIQVKQRRFASAPPAERVQVVKVLSIWETDWEDVERVRGIVEPQYQDGVTGNSVAISKKKPVNCEVTMLFDGVPYD